MSKLQKYEQTTYETCLTCCLLQAVDRVKPIKITKKLEIACISHSLKTNKYDFVAGHLDFIKKKFGIHFERVMEDGQKIDLQLIDKLVKKAPIIYVDAYYLFGPHHYPHFITIMAKQEGNYLVFDTWDGTEKIIKRKTLSKSIKSLRKHLKFRPQILIIKNHLT